jgi:hypothetical protein
VKFKRHYKIVLASHTKQLSKQLLIYKVCSILLSSTLSNYYSISVSFYFIYSRNPLNKPFKLILFLFIPYFIRRLQSQSPPVVISQFLFLFVRDGRLTWRQLAGCEFVEAEFGS